MLVHFFLPIAISLSVQRAIVQYGTLSLEEFVGGIIRHLRTMLAALQNCSYVMLHMPRIQIVRV
jgi:hypothetical protein